MSGIQQPAFEVSQPESMQWNRTGIGYSTTIVTGKPNPIDKETIERVRSILNDQAHT